MSNIMPQNLSINGVMLNADFISVKLTRQEAEMMKIMIDNFGHCVRKNQLFDLIYGDDPNGGPVSNVLPVFITKLRTKLKESNLPLFIATHRGVGWELRSSS